MEVITVGIAKHAIVETQGPAGPTAFQCGPLEITLAVVHFNHKHTKRQKQWRELSKSLTCVNLIMCADHNSLIVKHRDAAKPPYFEHDSALAAREQQLQEIAKAGLQDVWVDIHCPDIVDIKDKGASWPTGFTMVSQSQGRH